MLQFFVRLFIYSYKNNIKMFWYSCNISHKIIEIKERPLKHLSLLTSMNWKCMKKQSSIIFELNNMGKKKCDSKALLQKAWFLPASNLNLEIRLNPLNLIWKNKCSLNLRKFHRKIPVSEPSLNKKVLVRIFIEETTIY